MFKWATRSYRMELEELKHSHTLELARKDEAFNTERRRFTEDKDRAIKMLREDTAREMEKVKADSEIKLKEALTLAKLETQQGIKKAELDAQAKLNKDTQALQEDFYAKMTEAMSKLHTEGNVTTKFVQDLALSMMKGMPANKSETKVLTGTVNLNTEAEDGA